MALTDKTEIVFTNTGRRKKVLVSWLLSESAMFANEANPFVVQDSAIGSKIKGETFMGRDIKPQLIARYPYLKTVLDGINPIDDWGEDEEEIEEVVTKEPIEETEQVAEIEKPLSEMEIPELKDICTKNGIDFDGRKKSKDYFIKLIEQ